MYDEEYRKSLSPNENSSRSISPVPSRSPNTDEEYIMKSLSPIERARQSLSPIPRRDSPKERGKSLSPFEKARKSLSPILRCLSPEKEPKFKSCFSQQNSLQAKYEISQQPANRVFTLGTIQPDSESSTDNSISEIFGTSKSSPVDIESMRALNDFPTDFSRRRTRRKSTGFEARLERAEKMVAKSLEPSPPLEKRMPEDLVLLRQLKTVRASPFRYSSFSSESKSGSEASLIKSIEEKPEESVRSDFPKRFSCLPSINSTAVPTLRMVPVDDVLESKSGCVTSIVKSIEEKPEDIARHDFEKPFSVVPNLIKAPSDDEKIGYVSSFIKSIEKNHDDRCPPAECIRRDFGKVSTISVPVLRKTVSDPSTSGCVTSIVKSIEEKADDKVHHDFTKRFLSKPSVNSKAASDKRTLETDIAKSIEDNSIEGVQHDFSSRLSSYPSVDSILVPAFKIAASDDDALETKTGCVTSMIKSIEEKPPSPSESVRYDFPKRQSTVEACAVPTSKKFSRNAVPETQGRLSGAVPSQLTVDTCVVPTSTKFSGNAVPDSQGRLTAVVPMAEDIGQGRLRTVVAIPEDLRSSSSENSSHGREMSSCATVQVDIKVVANAAVNSSSGQNNGYLKV